MESGLLTPLVLEQPRVEPYRHNDFIYKPGFALNLGLHPIHPEE